jgi:hypothetical protein
MGRPMGDPMRPEPDNPHTLAERPRPLDVLARQRPKVAWLSGSRVRPAPCSNRYCLGLDMGIIDNPDSANAEVSPRSPG